MELKPGYKQTEIGVAPEDWDMKTLGDLFYFSGGYSASRDQLSTDGHCYLHYGDIHGSTKVWIDTQADYLNIPKLNISLKEVASKFLLNDGDVVFVDVSEDDGGTSKHVVVVNKHNIPFISGLHTIVAKSKNDELSHEYRRYCFQTSAIRQQFSFYAVGTKVSGISKTNIAKIAILVPSVFEQNAIAEALSDVEALLGALDRLIAKKRDLKRATMQQLLTPPSARVCRLPGFHGEWEIKALSDLFHFSGGYSASRNQLSTDGHCYLHYGDIHGATKTWIDTRADYQDIPKLNIPLKRISPNSLLKDGDIVFVDASEDDDGASKHVVVVNKDNVPFIAGLHTIVAKSKTDELIHAYRQYCFQTAAIREQFLFYAVGTKVSGISKTNIAKLMLPIPSVPEQIAIAEVLADMDAELAALEARREKACALKLGMMQELLTGRTRLVERPSNIITVDFAATSKLISAQQQPKVKPHNWAFNEAVVIAVLVKQFGSEQYPLGRKRYTKLAYLMHRHVEHVAQGYLKKAAGPYNPDVKYKGPEAIAKKNGYIRVAANGKYSGFVAAEDIAQAEGYFSKWYGHDVMDWLEKFRHKSNDELELLTTVDMAMQDLRKAERSTTVAAIRHVLASEPEWAPKLKREVFAEANIERAIEWSDKLFSY